MASFCVQCGEALATDTKFCGSCGTKLGAPAKVESQNIQTTEATVNNESLETYPKSAAFASWAAVAGSAVIGLTALTSALDMPSEASYVTFDLTFENLMNGGWYLWYSGLAAEAIKIYGPFGMDAGVLKFILWGIAGFSFTSAWGVGQKIFKAKKN